MAGVHTQQSTKSGSGRFGTLTIAVAEVVTSEDDNYDSNDDDDKK